MHEERDTYLSSARQHGMRAWAAAVVVGGSQVGVGALMSIPPTGQPLPQPPRQQ